MTTSVLARPAAGQDPAWLEQLTAREREVLGLVAPVRTARDRVELVVRSRCGLVGW